MDRPGDAYHEVEREEFLDRPEEVLNQQTNTLVDLRKSRPLRPNEAHLVQIKSGKASGMKIKSGGRGPSGEGSGSDSSSSSSNVNDGEGNGPEDDRNHNESDNTNSFNTALNESLAVQVGPDLNTAVDPADRDLDLADRESIEDAVARASQQFEADIASNKAGRHDSQNDSEIHEPYVPGDSDDSMRLQTRRYPMPRDSDGNLPQFGYEGYLRQFRNENALFDDLGLDLDEQIKIDEDESSEDKPHAKSSDENILIGDPNEKKNIEKNVDPFEFSFGGSQHVKGSDNVDSVDDGQFNDEMDEKLEASEDQPSVSQSDSLSFEERKLKHASGARELEEALRRQKYLTFQRILEVQKIQLKEKLNRQLENDKLKLKSAIQAKTEELREEKKSLRENMETEFFGNTLAFHKESEENLMKLGRVLEWLYLRPDVVELSAALGSRPWPNRVPIGNVFRSTFFRGVLMIKRAEEDDRDGVERILTNNNFLSRKFQQEVDVVRKVLGKFSKESGAGSEKKGGDRGDNHFLRLQQNEARMLREAQQLLRKHEKKYEVARTDQDNNIIKFPTCISDRLKIETAVDKISDKISLLHEKHVFAGAVEKMKMKMDKRFKKEFKLIVKAKREQFSDDLNWIITEKQAKATNKKLGGQIEKRITKPSSVTKSYIQEKMLMSKQQDLRKPKANLPPIYYNEPEGEAECVVTGTKQPLYRNENGHLECASCKEARERREATEDDFLLDLGSKLEELREENFAEGGIAGMHSEDRMSRSCPMSGEDFYHFAMGGWELKKYVEKDREEKQRQWETERERREEERKVQELRNRMKTLLRERELLLMERTAALIRENANLKKTSKNEEQEMPKHSKNAVKDPDIRIAHKIKSTGQSLVERERAYYESLKRTHAKGQKLMSDLVRTNEEMEDSKGVQGDILENRPRKRKLEHTNGPAVTESFKRLAAKNKKLLLTSERTKLNGKPSLKVQQPPSPANPTPGGPGLRQFQKVEQAAAASSTSKQTQYQPETPIQLVISHQKTSVTSLVMKLLKMLIREDLTVHKTGSTEQMALFSFLSILESDFFAEAWRFATVFNAKPKTKSSPKIFRNLKREMENDRLLSRKRDFENDKLLSMDELQAQQHLYNTSNLKNKQKTSSSFLTTLPSDIQLQMNRANGLRGIWRRKENGDKLEDNDSEESKEERKVAEPGLHINHNPSRRDTPRFQHSNDDPVLRLSHKIDRIHHKDMNEVEVMHQKLEVLRNRMKGGKDTDIDKPHEDFYVREMPANLEVESERKLKEQLAKEALQRKAEAAERRRNRKKWDKAWNKIETSFSRIGKALVKSLMIAEGGSEGRAMVEDSYRFDYLYEFRPEGRGEVYQKQQKSPFGSDSFAPTGASSSERNGNPFTDFHTKDIRGKKDLNTRSQMSDGLPPLGSGAYLVTLKGKKLRKQLKRVATLAKLREGNDESTDLNGIMETGNHNVDSEVNFGVTGEEKDAGVDDQVVELQAQEIEYEEQTDPELARKLHNKILEAERKLHGQIQIVEEQGDFTVDSDDDVDDVHASIASNFNGINDDNHINDRKFNADNPPHHDPTRFFALESVVKYLIGGAPNSPYNYGQQILALFHVAQGVTRIKGQDLKKAEELSTLKPVEDLFKEEAAAEKTNGVRGHPRNNNNSSPAHNFNRPNPVSNSQQVAQPLSGVFKSIGNYFSLKKPKATIAPGEDDDSTLRKRELQFTPNPLFNDFDNNANSNPLLYTRQISNFEKKIQGELDYSKLKGIFKPVDFAVPVEVKSIDVMQIIRSPLASDKNSDRRIKVDFLAYEEKKFFPVQLPVVPPSDKNRQNKLETFLKQGQHQEKNADMRAMLVQQLDHSPQQPDGTRQRRELQISSTTPIWGTGGENGDPNGTRVISDAIKEASVGKSASLDRPQASQASDSPQRRPQPPKLETITVKTIVKWLNEWIYDDLLRNKQFTKIKLVLEYITLKCEIPQTTGNNNDNRNGNNNDSQNQKGQIKVVGKKFSELKRPVQVCTCDGHIMVAMDWDGWKEDVLIPDEMKGPKPLVRVRGPKPQPEVHFNPKGYGSLQEQFERGSIMQTSTNTNQQIDGPGEPSSDRQVEGNGERHGGGVLQEMNDFLRLDRIRHLRHQEYRNTLHGTDLQNSNSEWINPRSSTNPNEMPGSSLVENNQNNGSSLVENNQANGYGNSPFSSTPAVNTQNSGPTGAQQLPSSLINDSLLTNTSGVIYDGGPGQYVAEPNGRRLRELSSSPERQNTNLNERRDNKHDKNKDDKEQPEIGALSPVAKFTTDLSQEERRLLASGADHSTNSEDQAKLSIEDIRNRQLRASELARIYLNDPQLADKYKRQAEELGILGTLLKLRKLKEQAVEFANRATDLAYPLPEGLSAQTKSLVADIKLTYPNEEILQKEALKLGVELSRAKVRRLKKEIASWAKDPVGYPHVEVFTKQVYGLGLEVEVYKSESSHNLSPVVERLAEELDQLLKHVGELEKKRKIELSKTIEKIPRILTKETFLKHFMGLIEEQSGRPDMV